LKPTASNTINDIRGAADRANVKSGTVKALRLVWRRRFRWREVVSRSARGHGTVKRDHHIFKSIVNAYFGLFIGPKRRPTFFDIREIYPQLDQVTGAYPVIQKEFDRSIKEWSESPQRHIAA
jgi:hypothetical protein